MDAVLAQLVVETNSRAAGCWKLEGGQLKLMGFGWASDMPDDVIHGFQAATRCVPLDEVGFGIVKAAVTGQPAIGRRDANATGLHGSASWIVRFGANTSLAVPILDATSHAVVGVMAVSTEVFIEEGDELWRTMIELSDELGAANASE